MQQMTARITYIINNITALLLLGQLASQLSCKALCIVDTLKNCKDVYSRSLPLQEDTICLMCTSGDALKRGYLAAEGFGSQLCHLEAEPSSKIQVRHQTNCDHSCCALLTIQCFTCRNLLSCGSVRSSWRRPCQYMQCILMCS